MNLTTARADVRSLIGESSASFRTNAEIDRWINQGMNLCLDLAVDQLLHLDETTSSANIVSGTNNYALPSDYKRIFKVTYNGIVLTILAPPGEGYLDSLTTFAPSTSTPYGYYQNKRLYIHPTPVSGITAGLVYHYHKTPTDLSQGSDTPPFSEGLAQCMVAFATSDALAKDMEFDAARYWHQKGMAQLEAMNKRYGVA